ncbi:sterol uptake control protein 2 [Phlyctema vagabunda]|uniref:Sterol uptake control protein 2 n=1 Tax=Phlyctema vagabunda TaxID=108571 RepID=A0ABR4PY18_9HELO
MESEAEPRKTKPRRAHHKTRAGCMQCKQRKIKCDEQKPACLKCEHYGTECSYLQTHPTGGFRSNNTSPSANSSANANPYTSPAPQSTHASPSPLAASSLPTVLPITFTMLDLELFHFWTKETSQFSFSNDEEGSQIFGSVVVQLAFKNPFLMHELLALAGLHMAHMKPQLEHEYHVAATAHHDMALNLFKPELATLSRKNCDACFAFSSLVTFHTWASQNATTARNIFFRNQASEDQESQHLQWMKLHRGNRAIISAVWPWIEDGALAAFFRPWKGLSEDGPMPLLPDEERHLDAVAQAWQASSHSEQVKKILDDSLKALRRVTSLAGTHETISRHAATMAWMTLVPEEFVRLVEDRVPEALIILASYCVLLKQLQYLWWCQGIAESLLKVLTDFLGGEDGPWAEHLRWPSEQVYGMHQQKAQDPGGMVWER